MSRRKPTVLLCALLAWSLTLAVAVAEELNLTAAEKVAAEKAAVDKAAALKKKSADFKKMVATAYKGVFYDNNFSYIDNPLYDEHFWGDAFKQIPVCDCTMLDIGGQYRIRQQSERNMRGLGLTGLDDDFLLQRTRLFANLQAGESFRVYAEMLDAQSGYEEFRARGIEEDPCDLQNLFIDAKLLDAADGNLFGRVGRQELLYGSERLISPLDWANTRRTFDAAKLFWIGKEWNVDAFYAKPVLVDTSVFNTPGEHQEFSGAWGTYKAVKNQTLDLYYLTYWNSNGTSDYQFQTVGSRWQGSNDGFLWDFEGGVQYGKNSDGSDHSAGFWTIGFGHKWEKHSWKPTLWGYYDWASGSNDLGAGNGFNHLFPLAHKYLGFMDLFGRSNIQTPNVLLTLQPAEKWKLLLWYYYFFLQNGNDTPYNVNMTPFNPTNQPGSRDLGHELDCIVTYTICPRADILFGYSHFFAGQYYRTTAGIPHTGDADFFYTQFQWNF